MSNYQRRLERWLPYCLSLLLAIPPNALAQAPVNPPVQAATVRSLKVVPLSGNRAMNDLENKVMAPLVVQVLDQNDLPVEGAQVTFRFPLNGASASFGGQPARTFPTNADGQAAAVAWTANGMVGTFQVQVTASRGGEQGTTTITMTNVTRITEAQRASQGGGKKWWNTRWGKVAIIVGVAAVAGGVVLATRGGGGSTAPKVTTITGIPGSPTIGGPQ